MKMPFKPTTEPSAPTLKSAVPAAIQGLSFRREAPTYRLAEKDLFNPKQTPATRMAKRSCPFRSSLHEVLIDLLEGNKISTTATQTAWRMLPPARPFSQHAPMLHLRLRICAGRKLMQQGEALFQVFWPWHFFHFGEQMAAWAPTHTMWPEEASTVRQGVIGDWTFVDKM
jgi:hypothetical protein